MLDQLTLFHCLVSSQWYDRWSCCESPRAGSYISVECEGSKRSSGLSERRNPKPPRSSSRRVRRNPQSWADALHRLRTCHLLSVIRYNAFNNLSTRLFHPSTTLFSNHLLNWIEESPSRDFANLLLRKIRFWLLSNCYQSIKNSLFVLFPVM